MLLSPRFMKASFGRSDQSSKNMILIKLSEVIAILR